MERRYDVLVIGSGIAGLFYALKITEHYPDVRVAIITKKAERETSTNRAQGGIAAVLTKEDSFESHIRDTLQVGAGLNRKEVVEQIVEAGPLAIEELMSYGVRFTASDGVLHLGREGGHSSSRVVHAQDFTGREVERSLLAACRSKNTCIDIFRDHLMLELITYSNGGQRTCAGAFVFSEVGRSFEFFYAPVTMLASGGLGQVYYHTTNPKIATGDGVAAAHRAGVSVANMEFVQFHPTALFSPGRWPFLISEAVRGEGGRLKSIDGRYIMEYAHEQKDLAPRDIVARAIDKELKTSGEDYVYLDVSHLDSELIKNRFPNIYKQCFKRGFDITERAIPVVPSAHYSCGGVVSKVDGETELAGFYVSGEVAMSGMHGANRLASNSLLEAVVMAHLAAIRCADYLKQVHFPRKIPVDNSPYSSLKHPDQKILIAHDRRQLNNVMSDFVGIVRTVEHLNLALGKVLRIREGIEQYYLATPTTYAIVELRNLATVAELIVRSAISRRESRGLHYVEDYLDTKDEFLKDTIIPGRQNNG